MTMKLSRSEVTFNLEYPVENWTLDLANGVLVITRALYQEDVTQLAEGALHFPEEVVIHFKSGYAIVVSRKEDSEIIVSSLFPSVDGDIAVDFIIEVGDVKFLDVGVVEE